jgi:hypothetical protein
MCIGKPSVITSQTRVYYLTRRFGALPQELVGNVYTDARKGALLDTTE